MQLFVVTLVVFVLAMLGMAVGVMMGRPRLRGSCGGAAGNCDRTGEPSCGLCQPDSSREEAAP